jgi:hypothetical protein
MTGEKCIKCKSGCVSMDTFDFGGRPVCGKCWSILNSPISRSTVAPEVSTEQLLAEIESIKSMEESLGIIPNGWC